MTTRVPFLAALAALLVGAGCSSSSSDPPPSCNNPFALESAPLTDNSQNGNMFDVVAKNSIVVTGLTANLDPAATNVRVEIYHRAGTHVGYELSSTGWTLAGSALMNGSVGGPVPIPVVLSVPVGAGEVHAFYVTTNGGANYLDYTDGTFVGAVAAEDVNVQLREGTGNAYPFGGVYSPRIYIGTVTYSTCP